MSKQASARRNMKRFRALLLTLILVVATNFAISVTQSVGSEKSILPQPKPPIPKSILPQPKPPIPKSILPQPKPPIP